MKNFTFAMKWHEILKSYSTDIRREVYDAIIEYVATGNIVDMQPLARMAFDFIRYEIDEKARKREERQARKSQTPDKSEPHAQSTEDSISQTIEEEPVNYQPEHDVPKPQPVEEKPLPLTDVQRLQMQLPPAMRKKGIKVRPINQRHIDHKSRRVA